MNNAFGGRIEWIEEEVESGVRRVCRRLRRPSWVLLAFVAEVEVVGGKARRPSGGVSGSGVDVVIRVVVDR